MAWLYDYTIYEYTGSKGFIRMEEREYLDGSYLIVVGDRRFATKYRGETENQAEDYIASLVGKPCKRIPISVTTEHGTRHLR